MGNLSLKLDKKYIIVSGSNISQLNGLYIKSDILGGKNRYIKTPSVNYLGLGNFSIEWNNYGFPNRWTIRTTSFTGDYYIAPYDTISPDLAPLWSIAQNGSGNILVNVFSGNTSIKKQDFNSVIVAEISPTYIFAKGSAGNTLDTFFDKNQFTQGTSSADSDVVQTVDQLGIGRNFFIRSSDSTWRRAGSGFNQGDVPINIGQAITFRTLNNAQKTFTMIGNNLLQKLNSGRLSLNKKYLYKATGTSLSPDINGLRFYDSGLTSQGAPIYYAEDLSYKLQRNNLFSNLYVWDLWKFNYPTDQSNRWYTNLIQNPLTPDLEYPNAANGAVGTVTISSI